MIENTESTEKPKSGSETIHVDPQQSGDNIDLLSLLEELEPDKPLVLSEGFIISDGGHMIWSHYVDIGVTKVSQRPRVLLKAIEAEYGLEYSATIRLSVPHRFREYGETFIEDPQEGKAQRQRTTERDPQTYDDKSREQERALTTLGQQGLKINRSGETDIYTDSQNLTFGKSAWIYCTSILPALDERDVWRKHLPNKYDHESVIRQPTKFAQALGLMLADQVGPQGKNGYFDHNGSIKSFHDTQYVYHGPVYYTDDVFEYLKSRVESDPLYWLYSLFVKDSQYKEQREYRFVLHCETPVQEHYLDLQISGMMRDSLAPFHSASSVLFKTPDDTRVSQPSQTVTGSMPKKKTTTRTRRIWEKERKTLKMGEVVVQEELIDREQVIALTTESTLDGNGEPTETPGTGLLADGQVTEKETYKLEIEGVPAESSEKVRTKFFYLQSDQEAEELFTLDERDRIEELLEAIKRPFENFTSLPPETSTVLIKLAEHMPDIEPAKEIQVMSACWNSIWAICNLYECFGDIVESVGIEQDEFVAVVLKKSENYQAEGKLLIGPRGTYAFVLKRGDEENPEWGGEKTRLFLFPDEETRATFEEFGWKPIVDTAKSQETLSS